MDDFSVLARPFSNCTQSSVPISITNQMPFSWVEKALKQVVSLEIFEGSASGISIGGLILAPGTVVRKSNPTQVTIRYSDGITAPGQPVYKCDALGLVLIKPDMRRKIDHSTYRIMHFPEDSILRIVSQSAVPWSFSTLRVICTRPIEEKKSFSDGSKPKSGLEGGCVYDQDGCIVGICTRRFRANSLQILPYRVWADFVEEGRKTFNLV